MGIHLPASLKGKKGDKVVESAFYGGGGTTQTYTPKPSCKHTGDKLVWERDGKAIYGASWQGLDEASGKWGLIIDLASNVKVKPTFVRSGTSPKYKGLNDLVWTTKVKSELLSLDWNDMGTPPVGLDFWLALWDLMPAKTVIACMGSHGRTGTCMAALMISQGMNFSEAVDVVRAEHCEKSIESHPQMVYLHQLGIEWLETEIEKGGDNVKDLQETLEFEKVNPPKYDSGTKSTGVGFFTGNEPALTPKKQWDVLASEESIGVGLIHKIQGYDYLKECVEKDCKVAQCNDKDHVMWILPKDSKYVSKA